MDFEMSLDDIIKKKGFKPIGRGRTGGFRGGRRDSKSRSENTNIPKISKPNNNFPGVSRNAGTKSGGRGGKIGGKGGGRSGLPPRRNGPQRSSLPSRLTGVPGSVLPTRRNGPPITDARLKIIQKTRMKMTDAREKLAEIAMKTDARVKLKKLRERKTQNTGRRMRRGAPRGKIPLIIRSVNPSIADPDISIRNEVEDRDTAFSSTWIDPRSSLLSRVQVSPNRLTVVAHNNQLPQSRMEIDGWEYNNPATTSLLGGTTIKRTFGVDRGVNVYEDVEDRYLDSRASRMSQAMKARLDTPTVPSSHFMGVTTPSSIPATQQVGHRIVVSNLHTSVTHEDIKELFEDIGPLIASHVVRPGTAEVTYVHHKDAIAAVENYHNRQLDGQPMKCLLVNSRQQNLISNARVSGKFPSSTKSEVLPDISAIHKALFTK